MTCTPTAHHRRDDDDEHHHHYHHHHYYYHPALRTPAPPAVTPTTTPPPPTSPPPLASVSFLSIFRYLVTNVARCARLDTSSINIDSRHPRPPPRPARPRPSDAQPLMRRLLWIRRDSTRFDSRSSPVFPRNAACLFGRGHESVHSATNCLSDKPEVFGRPALERPLHVDVRDHFAVFLANQLRSPTCRRTSFFLELGRRRDGSLRKVISPKCAKFFECTWFLFSPFPEIAATIGY